MTQDVSENTYASPANAQSYSSLMMGDSVGFKGGKHAATLGPMLEFSGKYYWLVTAHMFDGAFSGDKIPQDIKLIHPAEIDCGPGETSREIGVLKYWSGTLYKTKRESHYQKKLFSQNLSCPRSVETDWALCQILDGVPVAPNRLRYAPAEREIAEHSGPVTSFFKQNPRLRLVRATGRSSGFRYAVICQSPMLVKSSQAMPTRELYLENVPGLLATERWNAGGTGIPGDSGVGVIDDETRQLIGIVWGRNHYEEDMDGDQSSPRLAYFTSIFDILDDVYEKHPELGRANLPGGEIYDPENRGLISVDRMPPQAVDLGHETGSVNQEIPNQHSQSEFLVSNEPETFEDGITTTGILQQQGESPQLIAQIQSQKGARTAPTVAEDYSANETRALQAPTIEADVLGTEDEDVFEIDSEVESVFSDTQSLSSQSSVQAVEVQALREAITNLFLSKSGVIEIFETGIRIHGIGGETMTLRLRHSLRKMGTALSLDSNTLEQRTCSRRIKRDAEYIAHAVRRRCDPDFARRRLEIDKTPMSKDKANVIIERWQKDRASTAPTREHQKNAKNESDSEDDDQFDSDFEQELNKELDEELSQKRKEVEDFILNSEHMVLLKNRLQSLFVEDANTHGLQDKSTNDFHSDPGKQLADESENLESQFSGGAIESPCERRSLPDVVERWFPQWFDFVWEPAPQPGSTRIRWTCSCGKRLYDDYRGLEMDQLEKVKAFLARSRPQERAGSATQQQQQRSWGSFAMGWTTSTIAAARNALGRDQVSNTGIPLHNPIPARSPCQSQNATGPRRNLLFLLFSIEAGKDGYAKVLRHAHVDASKLNSDNALFRFLREKYDAERKLVSRLSLRTVSQIGNCKLRVDFSNFIQGLHRHSSTCPTDSVFGCGCWPDSSALSAYRYIPETPTEPFLMEKNYLLHHFKNPGCLDTRQTSVLCYMPLKRDTQLVGEASKSVTGWGIYFEEDWHWKTIIVVVTVLMIIVSIALGFTWWFVKSDFSGGWGVASFCVTSATLVVTVLGFMAHKSY